MDNMTNHNKLQIGSFGHFSPFASKLIDQRNLQSEWLLIEEYVLEYCGGMWIGIYSSYDVIRCAKDAGFVGEGQYEQWFNLLQN